MPKNTAAEYISDDFGVQLGQNKKLYDRSFLIASQNRKEIDLTTRRYAVVMPMKKEHHC